MFYASTLAFVGRAVAQNPLPGSASNILLSQVSAGVDLTKGHLKASPSAVFVWTYGYGNTLQWAEKEYEKPDQLTVVPLSTCTWADAAGAAAATSFTEHIQNQARSFGASFDGTMDVGIALDPMLQGSMSFGSSSASGEYSMAFHAGKTLAASSRVRARAFQTGLQLFELSEAAFTNGFKNAAKMFARNPTRAMAELVWDSFGTHAIESAELGGEAHRYMYFESKMDATAAQSYRQTQEDSSFSFLWFKSEQAGSSTDVTKSADGSECAIDIRGTKIVGGDVLAKSKGEFCKSVFDGSKVPIVLDYTKLRPLWDFFFLIQDVNSSAGDAMKAHFLDLVEEGRQCGINSCQFPHSTCTYHQNRTWSKPCLNSDPEPYIELYKDWDCRTLDKRVEGVGGYHGCNTCTGPYRWDEGGIKCVIVGPGTVATLSDTFGSHNFGPTEYTPGMHRSIKFSPHQISLRYQYFKPEGESAQHDVLI